MIGHICRISLTSQREPKWGFPQKFDTWWSSIDKLAPCTIHINKKRKNFEDQSCEANLPKHYTNYRGQSQLNFKDYTESFKFCDKS